MQLTRGHAHGQPAHVGHHHLLPRRRLHRVRAQVERDARRRWQRRRVDQCITRIGLRRRDIAADPAGGDHAAGRCVQFRAGRHVTSPLGRQVTPVEGGVAGGDGRLQDRLRHRRRGLAPVVRPARVIEFDQDHVLRFPGREESHKCRRVSIGRVSPVDGATGGTALSAQVQRRQTRVGRGAAVDDAREEVPQHAGGSRLQHAAHQLRPVFVHQRSVRVTDLLHEARDQQETVVGDGAVGGRQLHGGDGYLIPARHRGLAGAAPDPGLVDDAAGL